MARKPAAPEDLPAKIIRPEIRLYDCDTDIIDYLDQFPPRSQPAAIKRAIRAALSGGSLGLGAKPAAVVAADDTDLDDFIG